jgi:prepilin peptidase CpaA
LHLLAASVSLFVITAAILDFRTKKIPNWITLPAALTGLLYHTFAPDGSGILLALAGFAVGFALLLLPWLLGGGGMGDVKLLAALGVWLGPLVILAVFGASAVLAAVMPAAAMVSGMFTFGITATRRRYLNLNHGGAAMAAALAPPRRVVPFAVPIAVSTLVILALLLIKASVQP